jgi:Protein kinase domain
MYGSSTSFATRQDRTMSLQSILREPIIDVFKSNTQFCATAFTPPNREVLMIVSTNDPASARGVLRANLDKLLEVALEISSELLHPLSYIHVQANDAADFASLSIAVKHDAEFFKHLLTPTQIFQSCPSAQNTPRIVHSSDTRTSHLFSVTVMSITSVGEYSTEESGPNSGTKFFKILHTLDNHLFPWVKLSNHYPPPSATNLYNEIRTLHSLEPHHNIIEPPEAVIIGPDGLVIGCVYTYHNHGDLGQYLRTHSRQSIEQVLDWALEIVDAVRHLHSQGIMHNDIHVQNIIMADDLTIRLIDLGSTITLSEVEVNKDLRETKRALRYLFSSCPVEERSRDPVNLREDLPLSVVEALGEESTWTEMGSKIREARADVGGK